MVTYIRYIFSLIILIGCDQSRPVKNEAMKEEIASREIKRISEAEIINEAYSEGKEIAQKSEDYLEGKSKNALEDTIPTTIRKSQIFWIHNMDSISKAFNTEVNILGISGSGRNISPMELELLDAYRYNVEQNIELADNIQKTDKNFFLYTKPLIIKNSSCLSCHGKPNEEVNELTLKSLEENYPTSKVTGYSLNEIIGMWSIKLSQKRIVQQL